MSTTVAICITVIFLLFIATLILESIKIEHYDSLEEGRRMQREFREDCEFRRELTHMLYGLKDDPVLLKDMLDQYQDEYPEIINAWRGWLKRLEEKAEAQNEE